MFTSVPKTWLHKLPAALAAAVMVLLLCQALPAQAQSTYADIVVDRSTPEKSLKTFLKAADRTAIRLKAREYARRFYDAWLYPQISEEQAAENDLLKTHMLDSLDLSAFPDWRRESAGIEASFMLWEILKAEQVTPKTSFAKVRDGLWTIPGTYLQMAPISSGVRTGDFVFTAETIANLPSLYAVTVANRAPIAFSPYRYYTETPGGLNPPRWAAVTYKLPGFTRWIVGTNTVMQLVISLSAFGFIALVTMLLGRFIPDSSLRWFVMSLAASLLSVGVGGILVNDVRLSGPEATVAIIALLAIYYFGLAACAVIAGEWVGNWLSNVQRARDKTFDTTIIRLATRIVSFSAALSIIIYGISAAGVPVYGIIAGFGVGGLAVALAAKPTLENILAGVILFLDGSIKVGDVIEAGALSGTVEDIGMRSTRIRSPDGGLVSVTNLELADTVIKNVSPRVKVNVQRPASAERPQPAREAEHV